MEQSNLSDREFYRLHGFLTEQRIERLLDLSEPDFSVLNEKAKLIEDSIREALSNLDDLCNEISGYKDQ